MKIKSLLLVGIVAICCGCIPRSLSPIYHDADLVEQPDVVGAWIAEGDVWRFEKGDGLEYRLTTLDSDSEVCRFEVRFATVDGTLWMDLCPPEPEDRAGDFEKMHRIRTHSFIRVHETRPTLKISLMDPSWLKDYLAEHPNALAHVEYDGGPLLTADTDALQAFVKSHRGTKDAWTEPAEMKRVEE